MKINNINQWLPKPYYSVWHNGKHYGNFSDKAEAEAERNRLVASEPRKGKPVVACRHVATI